MSETHQKFWDFTRCYYGR